MKSLKENHRTGRDRQQLREPDGEPDHFGYGHLPPDVTLFDPSALWDEQRARIELIPSIDHHPQLDAIRIRRHP